VSSEVFLRLLAIFAVIGVGWGAGRTRTLGGEDTARVVSNLAFFVFVPALLFRTTSEIDLTRLPWVTLAAFFFPVVGLLLVVYVWQRARGDLPPAGPSVRAISTTYGNLVQLGIPIAATLFGAAGLAIHVAIVSLHAITLLTILTVLVELDVARAQARVHGGSTAIATTVAVTTRRTVLHPVVTPVLVGLAWNLLGLPVPRTIDNALATLGAAVVPVCLVAIGLSLQYYGVRGAAREAVAVSAGKLLVQPALVFAAAHWAACLHGEPLAVVVMAAALPSGSNALLFAQRYQTLEAEATAAIVISTVAFVVTAPFWLWVTSQVAP